MRLDRWTPLAVLWPERYVSRDLDLWSAFDIEEWSRRGYDWVEDDWNGLLDFAKRPHETLADGAGDCEDYALVAASWALANDRHGVGVAVCWEWPYPWPRHAVAYDDERVYSSGHITRESVEAYAERDGYLFCLRRPLGRGAGDRVSTDPDESDPA
jgi:hypothetical protein